MQFKTKKKKKNQANNFKYQELGEHSPTEEGRHFTRRHISINKGMTGKPTVNEYFSIYEYI